MQLLAVEQMANSLMDFHGLKVKGWRFEFDGAKLRGGACHYRHQKITLSRHIVQTASEADVRNTILHEIAHALCPEGGHGPEWKRIARAIGCDAERCHTMQTARPNYLLVCRRCSARWARYRKTSTRYIHCGESLQWVRVSS